jgi:eukaryotic-like serine/threonine-protein kinase
MTFPTSDEDIRVFIATRESITDLLPSEITIRESFPVGGQGVVYKGKVLDEDAAVKIYFPGQVELRVEREIEAMSTLDNPNIVKLLWSGHIEIGEIELPVVATSLIPGEDLSICLETTPIQHNQIGAILYDIANAIDAMWAERIVHRDLKPQNILIKPDGRACVIDLGVARHIGMTTLTVIGTYGTLGYLSPEQFRAAKQLTSKSDVFALGIVAVECAMGKHPTRRDQALLFARHFHEQLPDQISSWKHAPLVQLMFHPRATKRPTPQQIQETLREYAPSLGG